MKRNEVVKRGKIEQRGEIGQRETGQRGTMDRRGTMGQRGVAMILALLTLLLLSLIAVSLVYLADTETGVNSNYRSEQQAYFAARAGAEEVRDRMMPLNANTINSGGEGATTSYLPTALPSTSGGVLYVLNPGSGSSTSVQPWNTSNSYPDDEFCHEWGDGLVGASYNPRPFISSDTSCNASGEPGLPSGASWYSNPNPSKSGELTSTAPFNGSSAAVPYKWVRVTLKADQAVQGYAVDGQTSPTASTRNTQVCWNGQQEGLLSGAATCSAMSPPQTNVFMITSMAYNTTGSRKMIQYEVARNILPLPPSALTLDGNGTANNTGPPDSNNGTVSGIDGCGAVASVPGVGDTSNTDTQCMTNMLTEAGPPASDPSCPAPSGGNKYKSTNYTGSGGTTPNVQTLSGGTYASSYQTVGELVQIVNTLTNAADQVWNPNTSTCTGGACPSGGTTAPTNLGTQGTTSSALITVIQGDWNGSCTGEGILLVEGNLTCSGAFNWDGEILAIGTGSMVNNGGGNGTVNGAMLVANICNGTTNNNCGDGTAAFALPTDTTSTALPTAGTFSWTGGGNHQLNFNSCDINNTFNNEPYRILAARELLYR